MLRGSHILLQTLCVDTARDAAPATCARWDWACLSNWNDHIVRRLKTVKLHGFLTSVRDQFLRRQSQSRRNLKAHPIIARDVNASVVTVNVRIGLAIARLARLGVAVDVVEEVSVALLTREVRGVGTVCTNVSMQ